MRLIIPSAKVVPEELQKIRETSGNHLPNKSENYL